MTYKKSNPIGTAMLRTRAMQPSIITQTSVSPGWPLRLPLNTSTELDLLLASSTSLPGDVATTYSNNNVDSMSSAHQTTCLCNSTREPSTAAQDDDYDNCDDYDNAFSTYDAGSTWTFPSSSITSQDVEAKFASDSDDSSSETDEPFDVSPSEPDVYSLSMSTDVLSATPSLCELPHWWGEEDSEHIEMMIQTYIHSLGIDTERKRQVRAAQPFIGYIARHQVPSTHSLQSIDEVNVYLYEMVPFGQTMPLIRSHWLLTTWDADSGLPTRQLSVSKHVANAIWLPKARNHLVTSILCEPDAADPSHFVYSTGNENEARVAVSIGYHNSSLSYSHFFPESAFHPNAPIDD